jgi:hypothetical protein
LIYRCGPYSDTLYDYILAGISSEMSAAGDVNGDGYNDILGGDNRTASGVVDLDLGGAVFDEAYDMSIYRWQLPPLFLDDLGNSLSPAGDFDGDGYGDFMFGCENLYLDGEGDVFVIASGPQLQTGVAAVLPRGCIFTGLLPPLSAKAGR